MINKKKTHTIVISFLLFILLILIILNSTNDKVEKPLVKRSIKRITKTKYNINNSHPQLIKDVIKKEDEKEDVKIPAYLNLYNQIKIFGVIDNSSGKKMVNVNVSLFAKGGLNKTTTTNESGAYSINTYFTPIISILIEKEGYPVIFKNQIRITPGLSNKEMNFTINISKLFGIVANENSEPLNNTLLQIFPKKGYNKGNLFDQDSYRTSTNNNGEYLFNKIEKGKYLLNAEAEGYASKTIEIALTDQNNRILENNVTLKKGLKLYGKVVNTIKEPLPGIEVKLSKADNVSKTIAKTNDIGIFTFSNIKINESYSFEVVSPIYGKSSRYIKIKDIDKEVVIVMTLPSSIAGLILDDNEIPIPDSKIIINQGFSNSKHSDILTIETESNSDGEYFIDQIPSKIDLNITVTTFNDLKKSKIINLPPGIKKTLNFTFKSPISLNGVVLTENNYVVPNKRITVSKMNSESYTIVSDDSGYYQISRLHK